MKKNRKKSGKKYTIYRIIQGHPNMEKVKKNGKNLKKYIQYIGSFRVIQMWKKTTKNQKKYAIYRIIQNCSYMENSQKNYKKPHNYSSNSLSSSLIFGSTSSASESSSIPFSSDKSPCSFSLSSSRFCCARGVFQILQKES